LKIIITTKQSSKNRGEFFYLIFTAWKYFSSKLILNQYIVGENPWLPIDF